MSNHSPCLREFISSIPICQSKADLDNILDIFQHLNCQYLAIDDGRGGWGVVYAQDLLSQMTKAWLGERTALMGHPRNAMSRQNIESRAIPQIEIPLKSAQTYRADLELADLLNCLQYDSRFGEHEVCLIVDCQGELLGQLDRNKIITYLASVPSPTTSLRAIPATRAETFLILTNLAETIDEITLPSKIETAWGQTVHANQRWQLLYPHSASKPSPKLEISSSDRNWEQLSQQWIASQKSIASSDRFCSLGERHVSPDSISPNQPQLIAKDSNQKQQNPEIFKIRQESDWNYLKIPLINLEGASYYWILAMPIIDATKSTSQNGVSTEDKSTDPILAAVSHELKSPLTGIVGLSNLLKGEQLGSLNHRQARYVELIHRSSKKMMRSIDDLLQLNVLMAKPPSETELINLEILCCQLYQKILTRIEASNPDDGVIGCTQPKLKIELGKEIAIANEPLLASVLSHLMLEALVDLPNTEQLEIDIGSQEGGTTVIKIIREQDTSYTHEVGLNFNFAQHLATAMNATVADQIVGNCRQLSLQLPKQEVQSWCPISATDHNSSTTDSTEARTLTILCLYPELEAIDLLTSSDYDSNFNLKSFNGSELPASCQHRLIEADSIEQAHNLARIWRIDAIIFNGCQIAQPTLYLRSLQEYKRLSSLPLITLDTKTTEAANQIEGLNVFPCLIPSQCRSLEDLIQVIQIAIGS